MKLPALATLSPLLAALCACAQSPAPPPPLASPAPAASAAAPASPKSPWKITATAGETLAPGLTYLRNSLEKPAPDGPLRAVLHLVRFESSRYAIVVIDQGDTKPGRYRNLAEAMQRNGCVAGCNGGFFHPDFRPAGLVVADGTRINRFENAKLLSGLLAVDGKGPHLLRRAEFQDNPGITQLLQSGPYLVDRGRAVSGLSTSPLRTRTFIATDAHGAWAIGLCTRVSLADLGTILADSALTGGMRASRALNLDGGSSSALYFERGQAGSPHHHRSLGTVRNFVGIIPK